MPTIMVKVTKTKYDTAMLVGARPNFVKVAPLLNKFEENNFNVLEDLDRNELMQVFKSHSTYIHTSEFETVGLPIYEALELGLKVVVPNLEYINLENENIFKYEFGNYSSAINAIDESIKNLEKVYCDVPIYYENWNLG